MLNQRIINFAYFVVFGLALYVMGELLTRVWAQWQLPDRFFIGRLGIPWLIALAVSAVTLVVMIRHKHVNPFLLEVVAELREVTWPTKQEVISHTKVVIATVIVVALILSVFDTMWGKISKFLLNPNI